MRLTPCGCGVTFLVRLNRSFWMRWVPGRRHYYCVCCKSHQLLSRLNLRRMYPELLPELDRDATAPAPLESPSIAPQRTRRSKPAARRPTARPPT